MFCYNISQMQQQKIEIIEVVDLLEKIKDGATGNKTSLSEILRLCLRLGKQLGNEQLSAWALAELNGYKSEKELPDYRVQSAPVFGHFSGPYGSGLRNAQIPKMSIEEAIEKGYLLII
jgi:AbiTii